MFRGILDASMGGRPRVRILAWIVVGAAALAGPSCSSDTAGSGRSRDASGAGQDGGGAGPDASDAAPCPAAGSLTAEPAPRQVTLDGGVPIGQLAGALAVARCNYVSRCFALSAYVANECVDALATSESWVYYEDCSTDPIIGYFCVSSGLYYGYPSADLLQAVGAGTIQYDARKAAQCIAALLAQGCGGETLLEQIPACAGVFACSSGADGGVAPTDGGAADGGSACAQLLPPTNQPVPPCATDQDCVGVTANQQQGPYCVAGFCAPSPCGIAADCPSYAAAGGPCNTNALSPLNGLLPTTPGGTCAPGLSCHVQTTDGGLGTCVIPQDVGGVCTDGTNCMPGLACACGTCEIPPTTGPCVNGLCEVGVAYCDPGTNVCRPVRPYGASCSDAFDSCAAGLWCGGGAPGVCGI